jgi:hypothetical protein
MISDLSSILVYPAGRAFRSDAESQFWSWLLQRFLEQHNAGHKRKSASTEKGQQRKTLFGQARPRRLAPRASTGEVAL